MSRLTVLLTIFLASCTARSQNIERIALQPEDSTAAYYLVMQPPTNQPLGVLVLLPGFAQPAESIFPESKLPNVAFGNGLLTVAVSSGEKLYADSMVIDRLNAVFQDIKTRYNVPADRFILGGYSIGGAIALRYTEFCKEQPDKFPIQPRGVFAVDSPIDLFDLWQYFEREIARNFAPAGVNEARHASGIMQREYGTPMANPGRYEQLTPFHRELKGDGNERFLKATAVRVYHDLDVQWYLQNRRRSIHDTNAFQTSEMINRLLLMGNTRAEFVAGRTGYRSNGMRHPHSWSIVDEVELVRWARELLTP